MTQAASVADSALKTHVRSFIDLRRFAADGTAGLRVVPSAASEDAFQTRRRRVFEYDGPVDIGAIDLPTGQGRVNEMAADEFVIVCEGAVTLTHPDGTTNLSEGHSVVLPRGSSFSWRCERKTSLIYMRCEGDRAQTAAVVQIDESAPLQPSGAPLAELLISPEPACRNHTDYRSANGEFTCGSWDSTPYHRKAMLYRHCELMYLLEGAVMLEDETGRSHTFGRSDIFVVEQGARCSWESREHVKKVYAIFRPAT